MDAAARQEAALQVLYRVPDPNDFKVLDLDVLLKWKLPGVKISKLGCKGAKLQKCMEVKDDNTTTLQLLIEEDEAKLAELKKEEIDINDTELGRERKRKHNELIAAAPSMTPTKKARLLSMLTGGETNSE